MEKEKASPGSQQKVPSAEGTTGGIFMWGQSLLFISKLLGMSKANSDQNGVCLI